MLIDAVPEVVWPIVCDIQTPAEFSSEFQGGEWLDGASEAALGARFRGRNHHPARGAWETVSTICEFEPERVFGWAVGDPGRADGDAVHVVHGRSMPIAGPTAPGPMPTALTHAGTPDRPHNLRARSAGEEYLILLKAPRGLRSQRVAWPAGSALVLRRRLLRLRGERCGTSNGDSRV